MNDAQGKKIYFGITLDNAQLRQDAEKSKSLIRGVGTSAEESAHMMDRAFGNVAGTLAKLGIAFSATELARSLYKFADEFEDNMRQVSTLSKTVTENLSDYKRQVIEMTKEIPIPATEAANALYQIVSASHDGAEGMEVLKVAAKSAIGGVTSTVTAADAITTLLNAYKKSAGEAESISDQLFTTVRLGKTTMGELGTSVAVVAPIAASFGVKMNEVLAAVATLTKSGTPTAEAMTQIRAGILATNNVLGDGAFKTRTLQQAFSDVAAMAGGSEAKLRKLTPRVEAINAILGLTGINAKTAASDLAELSDSAGATEDAFGKMMKDTSSQLTILKNNMLAEFSRLGDNVLESVGKVAESLNEAFSSGKVEKFLAVLTSLIAAYGTYKAAIIAIAAAQKVAAIWKEVEAFVSLTSSVTSAKDAMLLFNMATKTSAVGVVAAALSALVGGLVLYSQESRKAAENETGVARASKKASDQYDDESAKIVTLTDILNNNKNSYEARKKALSDLQSIVPSYTASLTSEGILINNNTQAIKEYLVQFERQVRMKASEEELEKAYRQKRKQEQSLSEQKNLLAEAESYNMLVAQPAISKLGTPGAQALASGAGGGVMKDTSALRYRIAQEEEELMLTKKAIDDLNREINGIAESTPSGTGSTSTAQEQVKLPGGTASKDYSEKIAKEDVERRRAVEDLEHDVQQAQIDASADGYDKVLAQNDLNHRREMQQIERQKEDMLTEIQDSERTKWEAENPNWKKLKKEFKPTTTSLPADILSQFDAQEKLSNDKFVKGNIQALNDVLADVMTYEQKRTKITEDYDRKREELYEHDADGRRAGLKAGVVQGNLDELEKNFLKQLEALDKDASPVFKKIFGDMKKMTKSQIAEAITLAKQLLAKGGITDEFRKQLQEQVNALEDASSNLELGKGVNTDMLALIKEYGEYLKLKRQAADATKEEDKSYLNEQAGQMKLNVIAGMTLGSVQMITEGLSQAAKTMRQIADITGDMNLAETADMLSSAAQNFSAAAQGAASGGWIGAIIGGVTDMISQTVDAMQRAKLAGVEMTQFLKNYENEITLLELKLNDDLYDTIFGTNSLVKAQEAYRKAQEALEDYNNYLNATATVTASDSNKINWGLMIVTGGLVRSMSKANTLFNQQKDAVIKGYTELQALSVNTTNYSGWAKFFGKQDKYESLKDLAPQLWNEDGTFNVDNAKAFLETNNMINDAQKKQIQQAIDLNDAYEDALDTVKELASDIVGNIASDMSDAIFDAVENGADAWTDFEASGAKAVKKIAQMMLEQWILQNYLNKYEDSFVTALGNGDTQGMVNIIGEMAQGFGAMYSQGQALVQQFYDAAAEAGVDMDALTESERSASTGMTASVTQESVDNLSGIMTSIQGHTYAIAESIKQLISNCGRLLELVMGIKDDTAQLRRLENMENDLESVKTSVGDMALKGIKIK